MQDFLNNLQAGRYYRDLGNGFCEQVELSGDEAAKVTSIGQLNEGAFRSVRIQQMASGGFSSDTKAKLTPSIPFQLRFSAGGSSPVDISVKTMTLYHPCPLRLDGVQPDAVLSLNDPSFDNPNYVVLIPLVGRNVPDPSTKFLEKILPQVVAVSEPDPSTGQYLTKDIPTGANWTLNNLFSTVAGPNQTLEVANGYYEWKGMPTLERVRTQSGNTITFVWRQSGTPSPRYIMLDTPVACNPADLAILTQRMPVTPPNDAIHAVLYSSNPLQRGIVHKQGPPVNCPVREGFQTRTITEESCDPWKTWAQTADGRGYTTQQIVTLLFQVLIVVAMGVGAFLALVAVLRMYDVEYKDFSEGLGKVTAVFFKNLKEKAAMMPGKGVLASLTSGKGPLAALGDVTKQPLAALGDTAPGSLLANVAGVATPDNRVADARAAQLEELNRPLPRVRRTRRANIPLDRRLVGPPSIPVPAAAVPTAEVPPPSAETPPPQPKKWSTVQTPYLRNSTQFVRRGGRTLRRDRDRGDRSRTTLH